MYCVEKFFPDWRNKSFHEFSPNMRGASLRIKNEASKYLATYKIPDVESGNIHNGYRCEDIENLTFENESFDFHISQDVLEHVFDHERAFKEVARTLKPGGAHIFTVPIVNKNIPSERRALRDSNGCVRQIATPVEYHGDPLTTEEGSLVTMRWGYDITSIIQKASGLFTEIIFLDNLDLGIRAELIEVFISRKMEDIATIT
jgi:SAM-dependent methyltransferase